MNDRMLVLLGPQQRDITAGAVVRELVPEGQMASITAGWQDREVDDAEFNEVFDHRTRNLHLYARAERVWAEDPALRSAHKNLHERLRLLRRAYRVQLDRLMDAWLDLRRMDGDPAILDVERQGALQAIRDLDTRHLSRIKVLRDEYDREVRPWDRPAVQRERAEIARILDDVDALLVAGGHVAVLLNRFRLFNVGEMLQNQAIIAWSAGAMVMTERVALFHDSPPQGPGAAEMFDEGLGFVTDVLALPHAVARLRLNDPARVSRLSMRFAPQSCITLDHHQGLLKMRGNWTAVRIGDSGLMSPLVLRTDGQLEEFLT